MRIIKCEQGHFYDADTYETCPHCINGMQSKKSRENLTPVNKHEEQQSNENKSASTPKGFSKWLGGKHKEKEDSVTTPFIARKDVEAKKLIDDEIIKQEQEKKSEVNQRSDSLSEEKPTPEYQDVKSEGESLKDQIETSGVNKSDIKTIGYFGGGTSNEPVVGWLVALSGGDKGLSFELEAGKNYIGRFATMNIVLAGDKKVSREKHATVMYEPRARKFFILSNECSGMVYMNEEIVLENKELKQGDVLLVGDTKLLFVPLCGENFSWDEIEE